MISNAQKEKRINAILQKLVENPKSEKVATALHRLLIGDCEGRLYKYMPIKEYTIPSLENNTLHISSPANFNDPFDCKIGIDIRSLVTALFPASQLELYVNDFVAVIRGEIAFESISDERKSVIFQWLNNSKLTDFITNCKGRQLSAEEKRTLLLNDFDIIFDLLFPWIKELSCREGIPISTEMLQNVFGNMADECKKQLVEEKEDEFNFLKIFGVTEDTDEIGLYEKAYQIIYPQNADASRISKEFFEMAEQNLNTDLCAIFKICCFSTDYKNKLMWSHYADSHKGICVEYDFSETYKSDIIPLPICYSKDRLKVPWDKAFNQSPEAKNDLIAYRIKALLTKDKMWQYEHEWRILVSAKDGVDSIPAPPIKCIYLGALCSEENEKKIKEIADKMNICLKRMTVDRGEYKLHAMSL